MVYRIDLTHFLTHMVDYFTKDELLNFEYVIISHEINVNRKVTNALKCNDLYPTEEITSIFEKTNDKDAMKRMYMDLLSPTKLDKELMKKGKAWWVDKVIYNFIINPLIKHHDIMIVCADYENPYMEALSDFIKDRYKVEIVNLNDLFMKGHVGELYIDLKEIRENIKDTRRLIAKEFEINNFKSEDDKMDYIRKLPMKEKIKALKNSSVKFDKKDENIVDDLVFEMWDELVSKF